MARENKSLSAMCDLTIVAEGGSRLVGVGRYTGGLREGNKCVWKVFKPAYHVERDRFFVLDVKAVEKALNIVKRWNSRKFTDVRVSMNKAEVWRFSPGGTRGGELNLVEPFIHGYQKWNSNSGWADNGNGLDTPAMLQALSHFSFHESGGKYVLCDLQGGLYENGDVILTDPVILSMTRSYGVTDLGLDGIRNFFYRHQCNKWCRTWNLPEKLSRYFSASDQTTFEL